MLAGSSVVFPFTCCGRQPITISEQFLHDKCFGCQHSVSAVIDDAQCHAHRVVNKVLKYITEFGIFLILIFFATDLVVLLIKYENINGFPHIAELGDQYRLLLKSAGQHSRIYIFYPPRHII